MRVLLCVDDDPVLDAVVTAAEELVETTQWDELFVLHVVPTAPLFLVDPSRDPTAKVEEFVSRVAERLSHSPAAIETLVATGDPAESIVRTAAANDIDLIVMGARGESQDFLVGSVSQKVVSLAETDVLVVRVSEAPSAFRALIAVDGSRGSEAAITAFSSKLRAQNASIRLIHVIESLPALWEVGSQKEAVSSPLVKHAEQLLSHAASLLAARGLEAECEWHHGSPAAQILDVARRRLCSLIVVGSHGHSRLAQLLLGPLTQRIVRHAPCSVLCARGWSPEWAALTSEWSSDSAEPQTGMA